VPNPAAQPEGGPQPELAGTPGGTPWLRALDLGRWLGPWVAVAALALWTSTARGPLLAVAALGAIAGLVRPRVRNVWTVAGVVALVALVAMGLDAHRRVQRVVDDFEVYWAQRDTVVGDMLSQRLERRLTSGEASTAQFIEEWTATGSVARADLMRDYLGRCECSAFAFYDNEGGLRIWDGVHRGMVPEAVQSGEVQHYYLDLPLFGYLYVTTSAPDGSVAMAAYLLRSALPESLGAELGDFATSFYRESGERIRVSAEDPGLTEGIVYDLSGESRLFSVVVDRPDPQVRAAQLMDRAATSVALVLLLAWMALALGARSRPEGRIAAAATLVLLALWMPFDRTASLALLFDPQAFVLPGPVPLTLGRFALLAMSAFTLASVLPDARARWPGWAAGLAVAVAFPLTLAWVSADVAPDFLAAPRLGWATYQLGVAALLSLLAGALTALATAPPGAAWRALMAVAIALLLGAGGAAWVWNTSTHPLWWTALWGLPAALAVTAVGAWEGRRRSLVRWGLAVVIGSSAAIPVAWSHRVQARMVLGEERLAALAAPEAPELEGAMLRFGALADSLHNAGSDDVSLLYHGWRLSGLADMGHPVWLQIWRRDGSPGEGLRMGVTGGEPAPLGEALMESWLGGGVRLLRPDRDDARYILTTRLANEEVASVVAPPFAEGGQGTGLGQLLRGVTAQTPDPLAVIPLLPGERHEAEELQWSRTAEGWQAEVSVDFSNQASYHAHYLVALPGAVLAAARATLLLVLNLAAFMGFWLLGQGLVRDASGPALRLSGLMTSFRARVTFALFGFFTIANALFGTIAYSALSQASRRSAQVIAERVGEDASGWYGSLGERMPRLASQVGSELLRYRNGELNEGSVEELVALGLHEGWTPYATYQRLDAREEVSELTETSLGRWEYVTAYRRLSEEDILAAQVPLQAGTSALQTNDLLELLGFVVVVGALLSAALAMLAGRALTRPILALQVASERVGSGDLAPKLPTDRKDEFAPVFQAFNRMVSRVRRARRQLVRTSRRTQLIMDEAAVGMVALDSAGRVTLVNPRAEELLGRAVSVGSALPSDGPLGEELAPWIATFLQSTREQAGGELQAGVRRVRVRVRRLGNEEKARGVVVAMDDVTDELRSERVLAWGEMARQVAHEVKNPLTPIKLSIQHVRRAYEDRHPDFEGILIRNADAMLLEIDRLAGIAQSFSRFGAPGGPAVPLGAVSVADVITEVMALYGSATSRVRFEQDVEPGLSRVVSRTPELKEVLVNLLENARMADGTLVRILARAGGADTVLVSVVDDGTGISEDVLPRIFEPQFSTRSTGTGLGLAITQRLVRSWGGSVDVRSTAGTGTTVTVTLRVAPAAATKV
jgi:two-component system nitrogen regulation sensor histidine kinase NtrY